MSPRGSKASSSSSIMKFLKSSSRISSISFFNPSLRILSALRPTISPPLIKSSNTRIYIKQKTIFMSIFCEESSSMSSAMTYMANKKNNGKLAENSNWGICKQFPRALSFRKMTSISLAKNIMDCIIKRSSETNFVVKFWKFPINIFSNKRCILIICKNSRR